MTEQKAILIVEDERSLRDALAYKLKQSGFSIHTAENGKEGLQMALEHHPDVILLDIIMPIMDGLTMLDKLREDVWGKDASVILLTNLSSSEEIGEALQKGVHDYLIKTDWGIEEVISKVKERLQ